MNPYRVLYRFQVFRALLITIKRMRRLKFNATVEAAKATWATRGRCLTFGEALEYLVARGF